jgi:hypothetical protein
MQRCAKYKYMSATNLNNLDTLFEQMTQKYNLYRASGDVLDKDVLTDRIKKFYNGVMEFDITSHKSEKLEQKEEIINIIPAPAEIKIDEIIVPKLEPVIDISPESIAVSIPEPIVEKTPEPMIEFIPEPVLEPVIEVIAAPIIEKKEEPIVEISFVEPIAPISTPTVNERIVSMTTTNTIKSNLDINTKMGLINQFFGGNFELFNQSMEVLSSFNNERSAVEYLNEISQKNNVDKNSDYYTMFLTLVQKGFR